MYLHNIKLFVNKYENTICIKCLKYTQNKYRRLERWLVAFALTWYLATVCNYKRIQSHLLVSACTWYTCIHIGKTPIHMYLKQIHLQINNEISEISRLMSSKYSKRRNLSVISSY